MRYIPVSLDTKDKNVLVLGGGVLVLETIKKLLLTEVHAIYIIASENITRHHQIGRRKSRKNKDKDHGHRRKL